MSGIKHGHKVIIDKSVINNARIIYRTIMERNLCTIFYVIRIP